jgi:hypothetical protein
VALASENERYWIRMEVEEAAARTGFSHDWLVDAISRGLIRRPPEWPAADVPDDEVMFLRHARPWLPHLLDAIQAREMGSAVLFGREGAPRDASARDSPLLTTLDDPEIAFELNGILSETARRPIYVVTWSSGIRNPSLLSAAVLHGRVLRDEGRTWRDFVETEAPQRLSLRGEAPSQREHLTSRLREWAATETDD